MTTPKNVLTFYAERHWGSLYGVTDQFHRTPHKGLDCALFHGDVDVPALHDGTVVAAYASSLVGHYVTVERADGLFDTYCHVVLGVEVGQTVEQGDRLGRQAVTPAEGGAQWKGQHTHLSLSRTAGGWGVWGYVNLDPTPGVIAVLTNTASSDGKPIDNSTPISRRKTVTTLFVQQSTGDKKGGAGSLWALAGDAGTPGPGNWIEFTRDISDPQLDQGASLAAAHGSGTFLSDADWKARKAVYTSPAPAGALTVDPKAFQPIVDGLTALGAKLDGLPAEIDRYADGKKQSS